MNKNKIFNWILMTAMTMGPSIGFVACSSDDDDEKKEVTPVANDDPYEKNTEAGGACYNILSQLSAIGDSLPNNWKSQQFEVFEGKVLDESKPFVRTVAVSSMDEAASYYNSLTNRNINASTTSDKWEMKDIGDMTYTAVNQSNCFATIDVNVKQLPKLMQLQLAPASAFGTNAAFDGEPYYRMGDVILDRENTYWVCVRQCYSPDENEISHWLSFQIITANPTNLQTITKPGMKTQKLLSNLGNQKPSMRYGMQLMAALSRTNEYVSTHSNGILANGRGLGGLQVGAMPNSDLVKVSQYWDQLGIWDKIKPVDMSVASFKALFNQQLTLVYNRYFIKSNIVEQPTARFSDPGNFYIGDPSYTNASTNMANESLDMSTYVNTATGSSSSIGSTALVVRHHNGFNFTGAVAKELSPIRPINSVQTVYRFAEQ
ncbi:MAG: hypothetical protein K5683_10525 [Prevotella sp.]|nr:hypothetical protein [Prevotella sp.]